MFVDNNTFNFFGDKIHSFYSWWHNINCLGRQQWCSLTVLSLCCVLCSVLCSVVCVILCCVLCAVLCCVLYVVCCTVLCCVLCVMVCVVPLCAELYCAVLYYIRRIYGPREITRTKRVYQIPCTNIFDWNNHWRSQSPRNNRVWKYQAKEALKKNT